MFGETLRALQAMEGRTQLSIPIEDDVEGYFDRECPSEECLFQFKILNQDWKDKVRDEEVFCPSCGHTATSEKWWTQQQIEHAQQAAVAHLSGELNNAVARDAAQWNSNQVKGSFISITMKVNQRPTQVLLPPAAAEPMRLKITCPACACHYAVIGAAFFCPSCGYNAADQQFTQTVAGIIQSLDALDAVRTAIVDRDTSENTVRLIVENSLQNAVTAFQRYAEALYATMPNANAARRNAFQNLSEGSGLWSAATGKSYNDILTSAELATLQCAFQQRHLLAHTQGIVDADYVQKSGDSRYQVGQRIVIREASVREAANLITILACGLLADASGMGAK
ncbi:hypothetical protein [Aquisediminimonas sediminicola]|uniref:hypothetical protein n=1 Tax=Alteraquisediminimonas sediminicola TaxID=2676787 RepID=UPI001C8DB5DF|nr:hypothetical protein [Aquisediminimonas sediminicola]